MNHVDVVKVLVEAGANIHAKNRTGLTPLKLAEELGNSEIAEILRDAGAEEQWIMAKLQNGWSAAGGLSSLRF